jgi:hypothetical protein
MQLLNFMDLETQASLRYVILSIISAQTSTAIYVDTEAKFRPERLAMIARTRGIDSHNANWLSNTLTLNIMLDIIHLIL